MQQKAKAPCHEHVAVLVLCQHVVIRTEVGHEMPIAFTDIFRTPAPFSNARDSNTGKRFPNNTVVLLHGYFAKLADPD